MTIDVKIAQTAKELQDAYKLRYQVYVREEGYFKAEHSDLIVDQFDAIPQAGIVVAYQEGEAIGTMRANIDSEIKLPADSIFDYSAYRAAVSEQYHGKVKFGGAGMLAIAKEWRHRRDVFKALIRVCCAFGVMHHATHILAGVNKKQLAIYQKLGYQVLGEAVWVAQIGEYVVPVAIELAKLNAWAFGSVMPDRVGLSKILAGVCPDAVTPDSKFVAVPQANEESLPGQV
ncbi:GNAT family N-acetyltransferase [Shewanella sp. AS16]|uniref:N-acyl amino acid synthase FeeM domain-containing protein n=1 Tax=Shewanella sp. AS16 TaxID=2907625 RepID=UPI001F34C00D|nr:GNAT family N-acyltransferase [Shewanella sp. AS16]MCE9688250.1 GNAT family N-acetyltransferase [Shewanella sp. AS16]